MKKPSWTASFAWGQSLILVLALVAAGAASFRARMIERERQARRLGLNLLQELRTNGGEPALAESLYHVNDQLAYLRIREAGKKIDVAWYRSLALTESSACPPPNWNFAGTRSCRPLQARIVDLKAAGPAPGDFFQAGLWVTGCPGGTWPWKEFLSWLVVTGSGLALVWVLAWRQAAPLQRLCRRAREVMTIIPPAHQPIGVRNNWDGIQRILEGLAKELKFHKVQLAKAHGVFRTRGNEGARKIRQALKQAEQTAEKEKKEWGIALAGLKTPLRHLAQNSRVLEQRVSPGLAPEDQGRMRRILRESEKALNQLLELETELKWVAEDKSAEQVNLSELLWKLGPELEAEGIRVQLLNPLPSLWLEPKRMTRLFRELIHAAAGELGLRKTTIVEVGYANLRDRLVFFTKGTRGAGIKKMSDSVYSWAQRFLQPYRGTIWMEYQPQHGGVIYFTLAKDALGKKPEPEAETIAEAA